VAGAEVAATMAGATVGMAAAATGTTTGTGTATAGIMGGTTERCRAGVDQTGIDVLS